MMKESFEDGNNRFEKITEKGFEFPKQGLKFVVGFLKIPIQQGKVHEIVMYKLAVGKSYCMPHKNVAKGQVIKHEGFDSIYLYNETESSEFFRH